MSGRVSPALKQVMMMKMKWMMMTLLTAVVCFSPRVEAMSLEELERGTGAAMKHLGGGAELTEEEQTEARNFEQYVRNFYRWILLIGIYSADSEAEAQRVVKLVPTEKMRDIRYFTAGIDGFVKAHKREGMDTGTVDANGAVLGWYLSQHPNAGFWQKVLMAASMRNTFGEKYPGIEKVKEELDKMRKAEGKTGPEPGGMPAPAAPEKDGSGK